MRTYNKRFLVPFSLIHTRRKSAVDQFVWMPGMTLGKGQSKQTEPVDEVAEKKMLDRPDERNDLRGRGELEVLEEEDDDADEAEIGNVPADVHFEVKERPSRVPHIRRNYFDILARRPSTTSPKATFNDSAPPACDETATLTSTSLAPRHARRGRIAGVHALWNLVQPLTSRSTASEVIGNSSPPLHPRGPPEPPPPVPPRPPVPPEDIAAPLAGDGMLASDTQDVDVMADVDQISEGELSDGSGGGSSDASFLALVKEDEFPALKSYSASPAFNFTTTESSIAASFLLAEIGQVSVPFMLIMCYATPPAAPSQHDINSIVHQVPREAIGESMATTAEGQSTSSSLSTSHIDEEVSLSLLA
jgi:hypothetical protein